MNESNITKIIEEIKTKVKQQSAILWKERKIPEYNPLKNLETKAGELLHSSELRFLNLNYDFTSLPITTPRAGIVGKIIVKIKNIIRKFIVSLFRPYFDAERDFNSQLVRYLNLIAHYVDGRDGAIFWELIKKIDYEHTKLLERLEQVNDELLGTLYQSEVGSINERVQSLANLVNELKESLRVNQGVILGMEGILARYSNPEIELKTRDQSYLLLENRYRGSEELITERLNIYCDYFRNCEYPVLEIGAGRGELQTIFKNNNINSFGVDLDQAMVDVCKEKSLPVVYEDGIEYLRKQADKSLSGLIAIQVVEHLTQSQLKTILELANQKIVTNGTVIFETINPKSLIALSSNYFRDPTHVFPQHPDTLKYIISLAGLDVQEVRYLSPFPDEAKLIEIKDTGMLNVGSKQIINEMNHNFRQLNNLLYAEQDFCIVARVR